MRILAALPYAPSLIRVRPYNLLRELARQHDVTVLVAGSQPGPTDLQALLQITDDVHFAPASLAERLLSASGAPFRGEPLQAAVGHSRAATAHLHRLLARRRFDVVHIEHLRAAFLAAAIPVSVPRVFDSVDCISLLCERTRRASHSRARRLVATVEHQPTRNYEAQLMRHFDQVAVTSLDDADALRDLEPAAPVTVVPNGVDLDYFHLSDGSYQPRTIVFSGKMSYHANVTAILYFVREVLPRVRAVVPDVRLRIVGSSPPKAVQALASTAPLIEVTGYLSDLRTAIRDASVAVCPVTVKVGIQNKILEAMAMGVPVVASAEGAAGLAATPGQDLLVGQDADALARSIVAVVTDDALRNRVSIAGRRFVERHHRWEAAAQAFEDLYHQAINKHQVGTPV